MPPPRTSPMPAIVVKEEPRLRPGRSSREATPTASKPNTTLATPAMAETATTDLATVFKADLANIRNLVTCSICDQLLYEPWTLGCGHTYCYSCLCNWFVPNRRKKTCPECRTKVKQMPAPNFLVKQMVEIFTKRVELMPADESIDQHSQRRAEEIAAVDDDKNNPDGGLFKGTFPKRSGELWRDEADGVLRCPECGHEHEGGPECQVCGFEIDDDSYPYSDMTDDDADLEDLDDLELDLEVDSEFADIRADHHHHHHFVGVDLAHLQHPHAQHFFHHHLHNHPPPRNARDNWTNSDGVTTSDGSAMGSDSEDGGSLQEFVVQDDDEPIRPPGRAPVRHTQRQTINLLSDDESDEGGAVSNRRPPRRNWRLGTVTPSAPSVLTVTDDSTNGSEAGDLNNEAEILRAGWSPLDQDPESDTDGLVEHEYGYGHGLTTEDERDSDGQSDTETMVGNGVDYEDDNRSRDSLSETPTHDGPGQYRDLNPYGPPPYINLTEDDDEGDSETGYSGAMDRDGDTEMSASPDARASRSASRSTNMSANPYGHLSTQEAITARGESVSTEYSENRGPLSTSSRGGSVATNDYGDDCEGEDLGVANQMREVDEDSSDSSVRPPPRRLPRRYHQNPRVQQYDPRISMMFAEHQQSMRGTQNNPIGLDLDDWEGEIRRVESASRNRRMTAYRNVPPRRVDPLRSSRSPSATRVISSSSRAARRPPQSLGGRVYN